MISKKIMLYRTVLGLLAVSVASSLVGANMDSGLPAVEVEDIADGNANDVIGHDGAGVAELQSREGVHVFHNSNQSISNSATTTLAFDTERFDDNAMHDTVTNNSRLTAVIEGRYLVCTNIRWQTNSSNARQVIFRTNGSVLVAVDNRAANSAATIHAFCSVQELDADDYIEVQVFQTSGGSLNVERVAGYSPEFSMHRLRGQ